MPHYFMDTSAVVKQFHNEVGSAWVKMVLAKSSSESDASDNIVYTSALGLVEVPAALAILARTQQITIQLRDELYQAFTAFHQTRLRLLPATENILVSAGALTQKHPLKAYDAVQLATAVALQNTLREFEATLIFVAGDKQLLQAAQAESLPTKNPLDDSE